jgi:formamidopyrimidine-DNA glycosylase
MPELPEVETIVRRLRLSLIGQKIQSVQVINPGILRCSQKVFVRTLTGAIIREIRRKGKFILIDLTSDWTLIIHLKMTGQVLIEPGSTLADRHTHVVFHFSSLDFQMRYRDIRKFGFFDLIQGNPPNPNPYLSHLGPDPFEITSNQFIKIVLSRKKTVKALLLDQSLISGLGNIYVDESLFQAKIHPLTKADTLSPARIKDLYRIIKKILTQAIAKQGSTLRDYRRPDGIPGGFQNYHQVYGRTGLPCPFCRSAIEKIRAAGRGTHYCPCCQKSGDFDRNSTKIEGLEG